MRPLITGTSVAISPDIATCRSEAPLTVGLTGAKLEQVLRRKRSGNYRDSVRVLDAGRHEADQGKLDTLLSAISAELPDLTVDHQPLGVVSRCQVAAPYVVRDLAGNIVDHFEFFRLIAVLFGRARGLAKHSAYWFVEVYPNTLRAISADGDGSVVYR